jgi:N-acetylneuraminic acid mutarotase
MGKIVKISVLLLLFTCITASSSVIWKPVNAGSVAEDCWVHVTFVPTNANASMGKIPSSGNIAAAVLNDELYCFGGINQHEKTGNYVWYGINEKYDLKTDNWTTINPPQGSLAVLACKNKIYSIGNPTQVYDPSTNTWINRAIMPQQLLKVNANVVDDKIYVISGANKASLGGVYSSNVNMVYDPEADSWSTMAPIPTPVEGYASAVLNGKIYIMGGAAMTQNTNNQVVDLVQIFNPKTNQWTTGKPLPTGVYGAGACATTGLYAPEKIYVVGGQTQYVSWVTSAVLTQHGETFNQVYDPATEDWSTSESLPEPRWRCSLVNVNDTILVVGGENGPDDSASFDNPEKVVLAIERYIPAEYKGTLPSTDSSDTSGLTQAKNTDWLLILSALIIVTVTFGSLYVFKQTRKTV